MENKEIIEKDEWQLALDAKLVELQQCQKEHNLNSCLKCEQVLECALRQSYVKAVYESMNKGAGGGFEF